MWYEADLDSVMTRTCLRPIPTGKVTKKQALIFGISASIISVVVLYFFSNLVATTILAITILFYVIYLHLFGLNEKLLKILLLALEQLVLVLYHL